MQHRRLRLETQKKKKRIWLAMASVGKLQQQPSGTIVSGQNSAGSVSQGSCHLQLKNTETDVQSGAVCLKCATQNFGPWQIVALLRQHSVDVRDVCDATGVMSNCWYARW